MVRQQYTKNGFAQVMGDLFAMPQAMRQLAVVQFFSWFPLFAMWIYTNSAVTSHHFGSRDTSSVAYNEGADWVSILMATYNGVSIIAAIVIPVVVRILNLQYAHLINLSLGGILVYSRPCVAGAGDGGSRFCLGINSICALCHIGQRTAEQ